MKTRYAIEGMHCRSCETRIAEALRQTPGVEDADVSVEQHQAEITTRNGIDEATLRQAVTSAGDYRLGEKIEPTADPQPPAAQDTAEAGPEESLYPLFLIVGFIAGTVVLIAAGEGEFVLMEMMRHFMAGFFIVFAFFKLLDPPGFVSAYRGYDLLARRSKAWAWAYPFVELGLGVAYLLNSYPIPVNIVTLALMLIGAAGVLKALLDKRAIRCACLGTALNLPMTKVTLVEDLTMAAMAAGMLVLHA